MESILGKYEHIVIIIYDVLLFQIRLRCVEFN